MISDSLVSLLELGGSDKKLISYKGGKSIEIGPQAVTVIKGEYQKELGTRALRVLEDSGVAELIEKSNNNGCQVSCRDLPKQPTPLEVYGSAVNIVRIRGGNPSQVSYDGKSLNIDPPAARLIQGAYTDFEL